jgi:alpha-beta hydrolase superfamily lysophospholipase
MAKKKNVVFIVIIVLLCLIFVGCTVVALEVYSQSFGRVEEFSEDKFTTYITWKEVDQAKYPREEVHFNSNENTLQGFIYGRENINGMVVISEGLGGTADDYFPIITYFVDKGWRVFAFNNTGVGGSEGESVRGLTQSVIDLDAALTYVETSGKFDGLSIMLAGHSWGGYAVCAVLNYNHDVKAVVSFAGYNNGSDFFKEMAVLVVGGIYYICSPQGWAIEKQLFGEAVKLNAVDGINKASIPVMIIHSSDDEVISAKSTAIYAHREKITNPHTEIVYLEGEDATGHEYVFCSKGQREYMKWLKANWETYKAEHNNASQFQWAAEINFDKHKANDLNQELMERINTLFNNAK